MDTIFSNSELVWHPSGYWRVSPMPSDEELSSYYSSDYWNQRGGKPTLINGRDLVHHIILNENI